MCPWVPSPAIILNLTGRRNGRFRSWLSCASAPGWWASLCSPQDPGLPKSTPSFYLSGWATNSLNTIWSGPQAWSAEGGAVTAKPGSPSANTLRSLSPAFWLYTPRTHSPANHGLHLSLPLNAFSVWSCQCGYKKCLATVLLLWIAHLCIHPVDLLHLFYCVFSSSLLNCLSASAFGVCSIHVISSCSHLPLQIETVTVWVKSLTCLRCSSVYSPVLTVLTLFSNALWLSSSNVMKKKNT